MSDLYYGLPPKVLAENIKIDLVRDKVEMCFYQYLPIKMAGALENFHIPVQLNWIRQFIQHLEFDPHTDFIYVSVKHLFVTPNNMGNRPGWHSDGFGSDDVNYIWSDKFPTQFCLQEFTLTEDHVESLKELNRQALDKNIVDYGENSFVRIDRWNIHRPPVDGTGFRTFLKFSVSKNRYNLQGNSHNYLMDYDWKMIPRAAERNHPTADTKGKVDGEYSIELPHTGVKLQLQAPKKILPVLTTLHDCMIKLPGARDRALISLGDIMDRVRELGVRILPICNSSIRYAEFTENSTVCLEWIIRDILLKKGYKEYINMNQCKPLLIKALVETGQFARTKTIRAQAWPGQKLSTEQRTFARPVMALEVLIQKPTKLLGEVLPLMTSTILDGLRQTPAEKGPLEKVGRVAYDDLEVKIRQLLKTALKLQLKMPNSTYPVEIPMKDFLFRWMKLNAVSIPVRHCYKRFDEFESDEQVCVEYILRDLVKKYFPGLEDKAQATPMVIQQLYETGIFAHGKEVGVVWDVADDGQPSDLPNQKVHGRKVTSLGWSASFLQFETIGKVKEALCPAEPSTK